MSLIGKLIAFTIGVYGGVYLDQNYEVPRMPDPSQLPAKLEEYVKRYKKE
uniref:YtxH domain-containing protein n=1 Tax=Rhabditophanes sp. KR3021 TaxID=114890 RepID=A0AC35TXM2_9BILA